MKNYMPETDLFTPLKQELFRYEQYGIRLSLQQRPSNSYKIAKACSQVREPHVTYMRDYISDDDGQIIEINFQRIRLSKK